MADPFGVGARLYRTGDVVRWNSVGDLEYLGRSDFQVKLRGQRLELGEVEAVLGNVPGVVHAAATVVSAPGGDQHLVGYVAPAVVVDDVRIFARQALPTYMVPTVWVGLDDVALTSSGKLDRKALPAPDFATEAVEFVEAASDAEHALSAVFADVLGVEEVSVVASFFELGGNSLSAMRLAARASAMLGVEVSVRDVFDAPSVRALIAAVAGNAVVLAPIVPVVARPDQLPLSFAQQRIWFINQYDTASPAYNIPVVLRVTGDLDTRALHAAVADVVARHEILRTSFPAVDGEGNQAIGSIAELNERDVSRSVDSEAELFAALSEGFDVSVQWPLRVRLWRVAEDEFVLALVVHHIASDGESLLPLVTDLVGAYTARVAGRVPEFVPLPVQFADYALWQHEVLGSAGDADSVVGRQLGFWRGQLAGVPDVLELPADRPRPRVASHAGASLDFVFPTGVGERVAGVAAAHGVT
ncbi:condensation domain-containing protein, partial [Gordonia asplenii]|uniref:condensation domain-containing protein n=1 Tax=Gordonia asplenii TaxID=2725283 RepID=UPI0035E4552C